MAIINFAYGIIPLNSVMKAFYVLDCDCQDQIATEALDWIQSNTDLLTLNDSWQYNNFWNKIDYKDFLSKNSTLIAYCSDLKLKIREVAVLSAHDQSGVVLHVDEGPVTAKINFPILNTADTYTEWYSVDLSNVPQSISQFGQPHYNLHDWDISKLEKIAEVEMTRPVVFNSSIPHRVRIGPIAKLPRIVISCMFFTEPLDYLNE